jgi:hypothetical protein
LTLYNFNFIFSSNERAKQVKVEEEAHEKEVEEKRYDLQASGILFMADAESSRMNG